MTTPITTVEQAGALAARAALRLGVSESVWTAADATIRSAALEAATADVYAEPGVQVYSRETEDSVQFAVTVQAIYLLDLQGDSGAQERRRLQDQGVTEIQQGRIREQYQCGRRSALCAAARQLLRNYGGAVFLG